jgi:hypothetical protein
MVALAFNLSLLLVSSLPERRGPLVSCIPWELACFYSIMGDANSRSVPDKKICEIPRKTDMQYERQYYFAAGPSEPLFNGQELTCDAERQLNVFGCLGVWVLEPEEASTGLPIARPGKVYPVFWIDSTLYACITR